MNEDGTMARVPQLHEFCKQHGLKMLTVADLIRYRMQHERYVHRVGEALVSTRFGEFRLIAYESEVNGGESHIALIRGDIEKSETPVLVRMHAHCLMGDVFGATGCECHATLEGSLRHIAQEGRGIGLLNRLRAYKLQEQGLEVLKQAQAAHVQTLTSVPEMVEKMPAPPQMPTLEGLPTMAQLTELNTQSAAHVLEQQTQYAAQIADLFKPVEPAANERPPPHVTDACGALSVPLR